MKKLWILSLLSLCLFLVWCWNDSCNCPEPVCPEQEEKEQQENLISQDDIFEKNTRCYEISQDYIDWIKDKYSSYDWTNKWQPTVFYSPSLDVCLWTYWVVNDSQWILMIENIFDTSKHSVYMYWDINLCERTFDKIEYEDNCNKLENSNDPKSAWRDAWTKWEQEVRSLKWN